MSLTEFNEEEFVRNRLNEGRAEGEVCVDAQERKKQYERFGIN